MYDNFPNLQIFRQEILSIFNFFTTKKLLPLSPLTTINSEYMPTFRAKKHSPIRLYVAIAFLIIINIAIVIGCVVIKQYRFSSFCKEDFTLYIGRNYTAASILSQISQDDTLSLRKTDRLRHLFATKGFNEPARTGAYRITTDMSALEVYELLTVGNHSPVRVTFNNLRTVEDFASSMARQLLPEKEEFLALLRDDAYCQEKGFTPATIPAMLLPDSYEVYWNTSADRLLDRMAREYDYYWDDTRRQKAKSIGLTPIEVATLASIVEEETNVADEMPVVAGLYINRLRKRIPLQADPTIKFAVGDFMLKRILTKHLDVESPYNTYKHYGLPPGPIRIASKRAIESVLNYKRHNYLYMCAKEDLSGRHNFASTLSEHNRNAARYHKALNKLRIMK